MEFDKIFRLSANTEIAYISGVLRVAIRPQLNVVRICVDAVGITLFAWTARFSWGRSALHNKVIVVFALAGAAADLAYQMSGSETVEFGADGLKIVRTYFGWDWTRHYALAKCSELSWVPNEKHEGECILECKVGWKKVRFGKYLHEKQAWEVLSELQRYLPEVAQKIGMSLGNDRESHITRLGLS